MRETVGSMRAYLILVGLVGGARSIFLLLNRSIFGPVNVPNTLEAQVGAGIDLALALGFLFAGIFLRKLLRDLPGLLIGLLCITIVVQIFVAITLFINFGRASVLVAPGIALLVSVYLLSNVKRLSAAERLSAKPSLMRMDEDSAVAETPK